VPVPLKIRILLADDHAVVRRGLRLVLDGEPDLEVVAEASDGAEAVSRELSRSKPDVKILFLSMHENEQYFFEALKAGACGYVLKSVADRDLIEACRAAMRGEPFIYPAAVQALVRSFSERARQGEEVSADPLTPRESEIVKLVAEGYTTREMADTLVISEKTVERHRANVLEKLGMRDRVDVTRYAIRR